MKPTQRRRLRQPLWWKLCKMRRKHPLGLKQSSNSRNQNTNTAKYISDEHKKDDIFGMRTDIFW